VEDAGATCPICNKPAKLKPPAFPFCSLRCKAIDMGSWLDGSYEEQLLGDADLNEDELPPYLEGELGDD
jgi:hypothetical protein